MRRTVGEGLQAEGSSARAKQGRPCCGRTQKNPARFVAQRGREVSLSASGSRNAPALDDLGPGQGPAGDQPLAELTAQARLRRGAVERAMDGDDTAEADGDAKADGGEGIEEALHKAKQG